MTESRWTRALLAVSLTLAAGVGVLYLRHRLTPPSGVSGIGGGWYATAPRSIYGAGHSSLPYQTLYRKGGRWWTEVSGTVVRLRYYDPDCVVFQTVVPVGMIWAVCGDRSPAAIRVATSSWVYQFEAQGLVDHDVGATFVKPIEAILALAREQPAYQSGWSKGYRYDSQVDPIPDVRLPPGQ